MDILPRALACNLHEKGFLSSVIVIIYLRSLHREWLPILPSQGLMIKVLDNRKYKTNNNVAFNLIIKGRLKSKKNVRIY